MPLIIFSVFPESIHIEVSFILVPARFCPQDFVFPAALEMKMFKESKISFLVA